MRADITVFRRAAEDPYRAVIDSRAREVALVLIDGKAYYGDADLPTAPWVNDRCESLSVCGVEKLLCVRGTTASEERADESLDDIRQQLVAILDGTGYPPDEQYGRADDLLPLFTCGDGVE
jgi:hypothetical protein